MLAQESPGAATRVPTFDIALSAVLLALGLAELLTGVHVGGVGLPAGAPAIGAGLLTVLTVAPLACRRRWPLGAAASVCAALVVRVVAVHPSLSLVAGLLPLLVVDYSAAAYGERRRRPVALGAVLGVQAVLSVRIPEERAPGELLFGVFVAVGTWIVGDLVRSRDRRVDRATEQLREVAAEHERWTEQALAEERSAIARELHDVIAHGVSVMGVQAAAARVLIDRDADAARAALRTVEQQAGESVAELQRLLGVLRGVDPEQDRRPQPGLGQVAALVAQVREAGVLVSLVVEGDVGPLPVGVDLTAYRVVQESLTNVVKHAGRVPTEVRVHYATDAVSIEVVDSGGGGRSPVVPGHGLLGMRERVSLYDGSLDVGPAPGGGFSVTCLLPLPPAAGA